MLHARVPANQVVFAQENLVLEVELSQRHGHATQNQVPRALVRFVVLRHRLALGRIRKQGSALRGQLWNHHRVLFVDVGVAHDPWPGVPVVVLLRHRLRRGACRPQLSQRWPGDVVSGAAPAAPAAALRELGVEPADGCGRVVRARRRVLDHRPSLADACVPSLLGKLLRGSRDWSREPAHARGGAGPAFAARRRGLYTWRLNRPP
mmetsp:Transcript_30225/g.58070  ORF Transcript_30225/g.58070 Transcript_30225/m.58070 type:complete len:206 (-) Transcript_30225:1190-1807(-)